MINFDDDISFDKEDCVLQISIKNEYMCFTNCGNGFCHFNGECYVNGLDFNGEPCDQLKETYNFIEENLQEQIIELIKNDCFFIGLLREEEQTEELCKMAVQQNGLSLQCVKKQTEELCKLAVQKNGLALEYVKNQTEEICKLAVQQNGLALRHVKELTDELCKLAVQQDGHLLIFVKELNIELCKLAILQKDTELVNIKEQTKKICRDALLMYGNGSFSGILLDYTENDITIRDRATYAISSISIDRYIDI